MLTAPVFAQGPELPADTVAPPLPDSLAVDTLLIMGPFPLPEDTSWNRFAPPDSWQSAQRRQLDRLIAGPDWPMPPVTAVAGSDLADWLTYHPAYDVHDAPGVGQTRFYTHWGLVSRTGDWQVDGRSVSWQRLALPMTPQFDPAILPSFRFSEVRFGDKVVLRTDTSWGERPVFEYTFRQGDYSDSYSEGAFRARTKRGFGLDLAGVFFSSDGRFATDPRDKRIISLETFGPIRKHLYWRARYNQFRDKSVVLTPEPFSLLHPVRNDLLWSGEVALGRKTDSTAPWQIGARFQSGKQRLKDELYSVKSKDRNTQLFAETQLAEWHVDVSSGLEELEIDSTNAERWYAVGSVARVWQLGSSWSSAIRVTLSDWDTDPPVLSAIAVLAPQARTRLRPSLRLSRERVVPTLFDRQRPEASYFFTTVTQEGFFYSEAGDPSLEDQWENSVGVQWGAEVISDSTEFDWTIAGHAAYIENYTVWSIPDSVLGLPITNYAYRPRQADARSLGAAFGLQGRLVWKIHYFANYALKYVTDLDNVKLDGYYPHKAAAMVSLIAPKWKYGVDLRLNAAGLWWYGDQRIQPTLYSTPHVFRVDLSGSARVIGDLTLYALIQNIANFQYRSDAGYPLTGRTVRFGLHVTLLD